MLRARVRSVAPGGEGARWQVETGDETLTADTVVLAGDILIVSGSTEKVEAFASTT